MSRRLRFDLVLNNLTAWAYAKRRVHIKSDGTPWRSIAHIEDIARAFLAVLGASREVVHNEALNVGQTEENDRVRQPRFQWIDHLKHLLATDRVDATLRWRTA